MQVFNNKWFKVPFRISLYSFAVIGAFLTFSYLAMKFQWTRDSGRLDVNNRYFQDINDKYNQSYRVDSAQMVRNHYESLQRIMLVNDFYPKNAQIILNVWSKNKDEFVVMKMLDAFDLQMMNNQNYQQELKKLNSKLKNSNTPSTALSIYNWMNIAEWKHFRLALIKDKPYIDSAAEVTGVEARVIVTCLVGEQIRLFNSRRERFKGLIAPLRTLALETNSSYGVTGIKESTAAAIEHYLKDKSSPYYLGKSYENLLDYDTITDYKNKLNDTLSLRISRLVQLKNHYYSYLYAAIFVKQIKMQWERAGYPIDERPEILASLFNLGFYKSVPKKNPGVGGSVFNVGDKSFTFGSVAFEFYYSGELAEYYPYESKRFDYKQHNKSKK